jgi:alkylhydroperoxidase family enzyme
MSDQLASRAEIASLDAETERLRAREASITGQLPRIPPMAPEEFTEEMRASTRELRRAAGLPPEGEVPEYVATALRHPSLYRSHTALAILLMSEGELSPRDRELAVLRTGWLCEAPFEWGEHVAMGKRVAGLTTEEIERVTVGSTAPGWNEHDRAIMKAVEELNDDAMISNETWAILTKRLDDKQLIELPILVAQYMGVAFLQNSMRVRMLAGNIGLQAR